MLFLEVALQDQNFLFCLVLYEQKRNPGQFIFEYVIGQWESFPRCCFSPVLFLPLTRKKKKKRKKRDTQEKEIENAQKSGKKREEKAPRRRGAKDSRASTEEENDLRSQEKFARKGRTHGKKETERGLERKQDVEAREMSKGVKSAVCSVVGANETWNGTTVDLNSIWITVMAWEDTHLLQKIWVWRKLFWFCFCLCRLVFKWKPEKLKICLLRFQFMTTVNACSCGRNT